ncbi:hypothetical protein [Candidatus Puniceispirillum sp.]|jgi:hypothetical protein|nr:hypothetical protein [Candidatus Puniceispirillum sp.]
MRRQVKIKQGKLTDETQTQSQPLANRGIAAQVQTPMPDAATPKRRNII